MSTDCQIVFEAIGIAVTAVSIAVSLMYEVMAALGHNRTIGQAIVAGIRWLFLRCTGREILADTTHARICATLSRRPTRQRFIRDVPSVSSMRLEIQA